MPTTRRWVDVGGGIEELVVEEVIDENRSSEESIRRPSRRAKQNTSTPPGPPARLSADLITPPDSKSKRANAVSVLPSKRGHDDFEHKLTVLDSKGQRLPRMAFRWYDANSQGLNSAKQIRAGLFFNPHSPVPPPLSGNKLRKALLSHLTPEKQLSPFISVFQNFLPAVHRALKSEKEAYVAIIDLRQAVEDSRSRFPDAAEVAWPIKVVIKRHEFKLRNHYKGNEWLIHGIIDRSAIIQTIKVSDLRDFARTGRIRHMRDVLDYITQQQHAFGLLDRLKTKLPRTGYRTGTLVGNVVDYLQIPEQHRKVLARKVKNMMKFEGSRSLPRERAYLRGVYGMEITDSDVDIDAVDDFISDSDGSDGYDSNASYREDNGHTLGRRIKALGAKDDVSSDDESDMPSSSSTVDDNESDTPSSSEIDDEQALIDDQLHATEREWLMPAPQRKMLQMSHIEVPALTAEQIAGYKIVGRTETAKTETIDFTNDADDEEEDHMTEVAPGTCEEDVVVVASAKRERRTMNLPIRSSSTRSTIGPHGLARLEADADRDVMEVMQYD